MDITKEEFNHQFKETLDTLIQQMAENPAVSVESFYNMTCVLENLSFFSPFVFDLIKKPKE